MTGIGSVLVVMGHVRDRGSNSDGTKIRFRSSLVPPYLRKVFHHQQVWSKRDLEDKRYVCIGADGVCFTPRMDRNRRRMLVVIGVDEHGEKDVLAIEDGFLGTADS